MKNNTRLGRLVHRPQNVVAAFASASFVPPAPAHVSPPASLQRLVNDEGNRFQRDAISFAVSSTDVKMAPPLAAVSRLGKAREKRLFATRSSLNVNGS